MRRKGGSAKLPLFHLEECTMSEPRVGINKVVSVTYSILDDKQEVVEQIEVPVSYLHGRDRGLFEPIERALEGKSVGDEVTVNLSAKEGFGEWDPSKSFSDAIENVPPDYRKLGAEAEFENEKGDKLTMVVTHVDEGTVTLDGNHPFAGKDLTFHVTVTDIRDASPEEVASGDVQERTGTLH